ncbi:MAG TPA: hypothetical protein VEZ71_15260, partial [Archangium sp.]|nr:hypothetical protein [Archangium sp.]
NCSLNENPITSTKQPISVGGKTISAQEKDGQVQVTSSSVGMVVTLVAEYEGFTGVGTLTVEESDLLIYAPDGYVYRVPKDVWALKADSWVDKNPNPTNPPQPVPGVVARYNSGNLPAIQKQLAKAMEVANIPNPSGDKAGSGTSGNDNITCFLLNLNSILLNPGK